MLIAEGIAAIAIILLAIHRITRVWRHVQRQPFGINPRQVRALYWPAMWLVAVLAYAVFHFA
jgi:hypothetical protein